MSCKKNAKILWFNIIVKYKILRWQRLDRALSNLYAVYIDLKDIKNAEIVNKYFGMICTMPDYDQHFIYLLNSAELYTYRDRSDTAKEIVESILKENVVLSKQIKNRCFYLLRYIAFNDNDIINYKIYDDKINDLKANFSQEYGNVMQLLTNRDRDFGDNVLYDSINYYSRWALVSSAKNYAMELLLKKGDSLFILQQSNNNLAQGRIRDSLHIQKQESEISSIRAANAEKEEKKSKRDKITITTILSLLVFLIIAVSTASFYYSRNRNIKLEAENTQLATESEARKVKVEAEKTQLETEKLKFELESLRTPYLGHAIGDAFKYIIDKIESGIETNDKFKFDKAKNIITISTSEIFNDITQHSTETTNLFSEIQKNERYVKFISDCVEKSILFEKLFDENVAKNIAVPRLFFT